ncbi:MAG: class I SAM-dependent methyltransferase [Flavobacteriales bacterium]|jgi:2-polyprenyl-3-methyl-5-hydroxy-6-metoxy-1,4-benzoquinol methylase
MEKKEWFASWFDTPFYHLLYNHRDETEAQSFIHQLVHTMGLPQGSSVLDLACGKGRHSRTLHSLGMDVLGTDLSPQSISFANESSKKGLHFEVHDMREPLTGHSFCAVFNLFTSFGYFDSPDDNLRVIKAVSEMLKPEGLFVIDFLNAERVRDTLIHSEDILRGEITFKIRRDISEGKVIKSIEFTDQGQQYQFQEQVQLLYLDDFKRLLKADFNILHTFGDYGLKAFHSSQSPRLILIAQKK